MLHGIAFTSEKQGARLVQMAFHVETMAALATLIRECERRLDVGSLQAEMDADGVAVFEVGLYEDGPFGIGLARWVSNG